MANTILHEQENRRRIPSPTASADNQHALSLPRDAAEQSMTPNLAFLQGNLKLSGRGNGPGYSAAMQSAQQTYGNRAVQRFIQRTKDTTLSIQREEDEEVAKSVLGDAAVNAPDPTETDTMNDKEYAARMSGSSTVEEPKSPGEGVVAPDKGSSSAEEQARAEREKQDDKEIYERELRRAQQERIRDTSIPLNNVGEENLRGQVRDGAFTPLGGQRRVNPWGL